MNITKVQLFPNGSLVATGRIFSGTIGEGDEVYLVGVDKQTDADQVSIYMGEFREVVSCASAGNIIALTGLDEIRAGETIVDVEYQGAMTPFESAKYITEPVMAVAVEPRKPADLPKLTEAMNRLSLEDPNLFTSINPETGQYLVRGVGELHLEIAVRFLTQYDGGIMLETSSPIVTYRESISKQGSVVMVKSANKKNRFWVQVEPLEPKITKMTRKKDLSKEIERQQINMKLAKKVEDPSETTRRAWSVENSNSLIDLTEGTQNLKDVKGEVTSGFHWACNTGPLCGEPLRDVKAKLIDADLSEKVEERDSMQISRSIGRAILGSFLTADPFLLEPIYKIDLTVPSQWFGACTNIITRRRGRIQLARNRGALSFIKGLIPVKETFGLSGEMRSATSGRGFWQLTFDRWQRVPESISFKVIRRIRGLRGLPLEIPKPEKFIDET
jgi:elongation factor 2